MRKLTLFFVFITLAFYRLDAAQNYYIIEDDFGIQEKYEVNDYFLKVFEHFIRIESNMYSQQDNNLLYPFLMNIYRALKGGVTITYNKSHNTIDLDDSYITCVSKNDLKKWRGKHATGLDATFNTKKQRFYKAIETLGGFGYVHFLSYDGASMYNNLAR